MSEFTKGEWRFSYGGRKFFIFANPSNAFVSPNPVGECYSAADANLISAAPDMYEALESFIDGAEYILCGLSNPGEINICLNRIKLAKAALAKAKGESHER